MSSIIEELPPDCIVAILKFLNATDLNEFACCSLRCDQVRNAGVWSKQTDPRITYLLDTRRTGFVTVKTKGATYVNLLDAIICGEWNNHPRSAYPTRLDLYGFDKLEHGLTHQYKMIAHISRYETVRLSRVRELQITTTDDDTRALASDKARNFVRYFLAHLVPNVREVVFSVSKQLVHAQTLMAREFCASMRYLQKICSLPHPDYLLCRVPETDIPDYARAHLFNLDGDDFKDAPYLNELHLDGHILHDSDKLERSYLEGYYLFNGENRYLLKKCCGLKRVSIMHLGRTYLEGRDLFGDDEDNDEDDPYLFGDDEDEEWITEPISQKAIMKFVRFTPTLSWLRSELTDKNVAILRLERPDITFVCKNSTWL
jgi:hypothetical protein